MELRTLIEQMIRDNLQEKNVNDMEVSAEMKSLLQMRNITSSFAKSPKEASIKKDKQDLSKEIGKAINQLKRKEEDKPSKYDGMLPNLVKQYEEIMKKRKELSGSSFPYQAPKSFTDGRKTE
jgi:DNA helicase IV